jgi:hypothetical protein
LGIAALIRVAAIAASGRAAIPAVIRIAAIPAIVWITRISVAPAIRAIGSAPLIRTAWSVHTVILVPVRALIRIRRIIPLRPSIGCLPGITVPDTEPVSGNLPRHLRRSASLLLIQPGLLDPGIPAGWILLFFSVKSHLSLFRLTLTPF